MKYLLFFITLFALAQSPTGVPSTSGGSIGVAVLPNAVLNNQANTFTSGLQDFSAATVALPAKFNVRPCEIVIGMTGAASAVLADDNDALAVCGNVYGATLTITKVECYANAGTPTVTPIITGGSATSILSGALTCGAASFATGSLNGTPTQLADGTINGNITVAGGTAKYIVIRITRTL